MSIDSFAPLAGNWTVPVVVIAAIVVDLFSFHIDFFLFVSIVQFIGVHRSFVAESYVIFTFYDDTKNQRF